LPQSVTSSLPLVTPSLHDGAWQQVAMSASQPAVPQTSLAQSSFEAHVKPSAQPLQLAPPQSMSVSSWLVAASSQLGGAHSESSPHTSLAQSLPAVQGLPAGQPGQSPPPQSVRISLPFCTLSPHATIAHSLELAQKSPLAQSVLRAQAAPAAHASQLPPQSVSVSSWLRCWSLQLAIEQEPESQRREAQSAATLQVDPTAQASGQLPPQSTPVSLPFLRPSVQLALQTPSAHAPL
jgi:hypothetical protein